MHVSPERKQWSLDQCTKVAFPFVERHWRDVDARILLEKRQPLIQKSEMSTWVLIVLFGGFRLLQMALTRWKVSEELSERTEESHTNMPIACGIRMCTRCAIVSNFRSGSCVRVQTTIYIYKLYSNEHQKRIRSCGATPSHLRDALLAFGILWSARNFLCQIQPIKLFSFDGFIWQLVLVHWMAGARVWSSIKNVSTSFLSVSPRIDDRRVGFFSVVMDEWSGREMQ